jgi:hypothetical protein
VFFRTLLVTFFAEDVEC